MDGFVGEVGEVDGTLYPLHLRGPPGHFAQIVPAAPLPMAACHRQAVRNHAPAEWADGSGPAGDDSVHIYRVHWPTGWGGARSPDGNKISSGVPGKAVILRN